MSLCKYTTQVNFCSIVTTYIDINKQEESNEWKAERKSELALTNHGLSTNTLIRYSTYKTYEII